MKKRLFVLVLLGLLLAALFIPGVAQAERYGVDYAWHGTLDPSAFQRAGFSFVCRYLSGGKNTKDLTPAEADLLSKAGMDLIVCFEQGSTNALGGFTQGWHDASIAYPQAVQVGMPPGRPIFFTIDTDTTGPKVAPYFQGIIAYLRANPVAGYNPIDRMGAYGGYYVVKWLKSAGYISFALWQTSAWSHHLWISSAIQQYGYGTYISNANCDVDRVSATSATDFGQWKSVRVPIYSPPANAGHRNLQLTDPPMRGADVTLLRQKLQAMLPAWFPFPVTDTYDALTKAVVVAFQEAYGLGNNGVVDATVWSFILGTEPGDRVIGLGNEGPDVYWLQTQLNAIRLPVGKPDGIFGPATARGAKAFEKLHNLPQDGVVGMNVWQLLLHS